MYVVLTCMLDVCAVFDIICILTRVDTEWCNYLGVCWLGCGYECDCGRYVRFSPLQPVELKCRKECEL
jgi:hypothetical protein